MNIKNFLEETKDILKRINQKQKNIIFIGSEEYSCTWKEFQKLANFEYDSGYGNQQIAKDLIIVFNDKTRIIRSENYGSEFWDIIEVFKLPITTKKITKLKGKHWKNLKEINEGSD